MAREKPFSSDGCSMFPDKDVFSDWLPCCVAHDQAYWNGGDAAARKKADRELRECLTKMNRPVTGFIMYWGVRLFGAPHWPTPYRWGYKFAWLPSITYKKQEKLND